MLDRRRNFLILLIVAGLIIVSLLFVIVGIPGAVKAKKTRLGLDLKGGVELVYQAKPTARSKVDTESLERAIDIMRKRVDQLGVAQPEIQRSGAAETLIPNSVPLRAMLTTRLEPSTPAAHSQASLAAAIAKLR